MSGRGMSAALFDRFRSLHKKADTTAIQNNAAIVYAFLREMFFTDKSMSFRSIYYGLICDPAPCGEVTSPETAIDDIWLGILYPGTVVAAVVST